MSCQPIGEILIHYFGTVAIMYFSLSQVFVTEIWFKYQMLQNVFIFSYKICLRLLHFSIIWLFGQKICIFC